MSHYAVMSPELRDLLENSQFLTALDQYLCIDKITHISLDVFDTLLRRACDEPSWVFEEAARRLLNRGLNLPIEAEDYRFCRLEAEARARKLISGEEISFDDIFEQLPFSDEIKAVLKVEELKVEREVLYPDPIIQEVLVRAQRKNKLIVFISDMYLPEVFLRDCISEK
ncbi:MAG: hypothetical protein ACRCUU_03285, partial [Plesiomonas sp.]